MLKDRLFDLILGGLAGFALAAGLSTVCYDKQLKSVQEFSHTVTTSAAAITARATARADSLRLRVDSIQAARTPVIRQVVQDTVSAAIAARQLLTARTARDSNVALRLENQALRQAFGGLFVALRQAELIIADERSRGDSLRKALGDVNLQLRAVNARIQDLKGPPPILSIGSKVVVVVAAGWLGYEAGRRN